MKYTVADFDYELPESLIAQQPLAQRPLSRLLMVDKTSAEYRDAYFSDLLNLISKDDLLVFNNTKVFPARLYGKKSTGGQCELLIERLLPDNNAWAHVKASKSPKVGAQLLFVENCIATVTERSDDLFKLSFELEGDLLTYLSTHGVLPLPPYISRQPSKDDHSRYQTVYAEVIGAVAAPTAGLHFDDDMMASLHRHHIPTAKITLHVGAGTFQPVRVDNLEQHKMHSETFEVTSSVCDAIDACKRRGGRVIAVGTTVLRALESAAKSGQLQPYQGDTDLFITPGFQFNVVDGLLTNFHLPKSTLLMLVSAFAGYELMMDVYRHAIDQEYRFFSYGDCMLILPDAS